MKIKSPPSLIIALLLAVISFYSCNQASETKTSRHRPVSSITFNSDTIKFEMVNKNWIMINGAINGIKANLIFDSGAGDNLYLDSSFARSSGLIDKKYYLDSGSVRAKRIKFIERQNNFRKRNIQLTIHRTNHTINNIDVFDIRRITLNNKADAMLGSSFLAKYIFEINYKKGYVVFHKPKFFKKPKNAMDIPIEYKGGFPYMNVSFRITDKVTLVKKTMIDLGCGGNSVDWGAIAVQDNNLLQYFPNKTPIAPDNRTMTRELITGFTVSAKSISLNNKIVIDTPKLKLYTSKSGITGIGNILMGSYILSRLGDVYFDLPGQMLYIK
ncbi:hypothetical protein KXQ82_12615 [Mucilaginibacter sp. HMF5004]|uniref:hypothetical protein n=1 Tax=Mucilaginibacter rivuli TaxID=2857527 RepID=UPI001C5CE4AA|nr:hypothetical protein [Mucilaginibacter rivuli]MBW4890570.1 hypothetical protein [Mucilaginibacter rivuli]